MKKRNFLFGALAALAMVGCSDNDLNQENGPQIAEKDGKVYMKVSIASPVTGTRALDDGFDNGSGAESAVKEILFAFYNQNGNYVGQSVMTWAKDPSGDLEFGGDTPNQTPGGNLETQLTMVVPVDVNAGGFLPYYVMAYVNPAKKDQAAANSLDEIVKLAREAGDIYGKDNSFVMNNSVYYKKEDNATPVYAVQIQKLTETKEEANKTTATEIYVERMVAKVTVNKDCSDLDMNAGTEIPDAIDGDMKIKFHPVKWALNATANTSYLVKQFRQDKDTNPVSYSAVDKRFPETNKPLWNDAGHHRSYWCTAIAYAFDDYPKVASQAEETAIPVTYYSYNEIAEKGFDWNTSTYCLEHTVTNAGAPLAAYTSVLVVGYYTLDENPASTFYTYGVNNENDKKPIVYVQESELIAKMAEASNPVCSDNIGTVITAEKFDEVYEVKRPSDAVVGGILVPSRYAYLQVKTGAANGTFYFRNENGQYEAITNENINTVNRMLMSGNPATMYTDGKAYYNIPIEHFGTVSAAKADEKVAYGSYGVVRNHSYVITVKGISGLGTGIANPEVPIIPPTEEQTYYVNTQLKVLAWKLASQGVILGE